MSPCLVIKSDARIVTLEHLHENPSVLVPIQDWSYLNAMRLDDVVRSGHSILKIMGGSIYEHISTLPFSKCSPQESTVSFGSSD